MKHTNITSLLLTGLLLTSANTMANTQDNTLRIATFNVSMEALNYLPHDKGSEKTVIGDELVNALNSDHQQIKNIAEIIQRVNPDIILLNEFDFAEQGTSATANHSVKLFLDKYLAQSQQGQAPVNYPYFYRGPVNTGVKTSTDLTGDDQITQPGDTHGFGYFPGHFAMVLLSKHPIDTSNIRTFQHFKWQDMPNALKPIDPATNKPWYSTDAWQQLRLSSKSHWDIPVKYQGETIHLLASHPTPPVFDGPEDRNGNRNHDEIRFWHDYITPELAHYIYDDHQQSGGIKQDQRFVILGDQNASATEGDAKRQAIASLLTHKNTQDPLPTSDGAQQHSKDNPLAKHHTAYWRMRADYVLPSKYGFAIKDAGVFWPTVSSAKYRLIENRQASSDHRLVWVDLAITE